MAARRVLGLVAALLFLGYALGLSPGTPTVALGVGLVFLAVAVAL